MVNYGTDPGVEVAASVPSTVTATVSTSGPRRQAGWPEATVLLLTSCMSVLGAVLIAPVLPSISDHFAGASGAGALVPIILTAPALMIGLLAPVAGRIVDRIGRRQVLIWSLAIYAVLGTAPVWLDSLPAIVLSRAGVGITEAAVMTCSTTLLGDYFSGSRRDRMFSLQTLVTAIAATAFFAVGGVLGNAGWRTPFWLYGSGLVLTVAVALFIWQPQPEEGHDARSATGLQPLDWRALMPALGVTLFGGIVFYALVVELPFVLDDLGVTSAAVIGGGSALASVATAAGAFVFPRAVRRGHLGRLLPVEFALAGVGLLVVGVAGSPPIALVGAVIASLGTCLLLPTLLTWALAGLSYAERGRATGTWTACLFIGQFLCPLLLLAVGDLLTGLASALIVLGAASLIAAGLLVRRARTA